MKEQEEEQCWFAKLTGKTSLGGLPTRTLPAALISIRLRFPLHMAPSTLLSSPRSVTFPKTQWGAADLKTFAPAVKGISIVDKPPISSLASSRCHTLAIKGKSP